MNYQKLMDEGEATAVRVVQKTRFILPHIARFFLISTFLEDGIRMWRQWAEHRDYFNTIWRFPYFICNLFVLINLVGQIVPSFLLLFSLYVAKCCVILGIIIIYQTIIYSVYFDLPFLMRNLALGGGLILYIVFDLIKKNRDSGSRISYSTSYNSSLFANPPSLDVPHKDPMNWMQLSGRLLLTLMLGTLFLSETDWASILTYIKLVVAFALMISLVLGYKTTPTALVASIWMLLLNLMQNQFWKYEPHTHQHDYHKFDFFQIMSVIGGLLLLVSVGPGGVSMDQQKKTW